MIMDNVTLGTLASWLSDCKVENETKLGTIQIVESGESANSKKINAHPQIWSPLSFDTKNTKIRSFAPSSITCLKDPHQKVEYLKSNCSTHGIPSMSLEIPDVQHFNQGNKLNCFRTQPYQDKTSAAINGWSYYIKPDNPVNPLDAFIWPRRNGTTQSCSKNQTQTKFDNSSNMPFGLLHDGKHLNSKVPKKQGDCRVSDSVETKESFNSSSMNMGGSLWDNNCNDFCKVDKTSNLDPNFNFKNIGNNSCFEVKNAKPCKSNFNSLKSSHPINTFMDEQNAGESNKDEQFERLLLNQVEEFPACNCRVPRPYDEALDGPFYSQLGVGGSSGEVRQMIMKRLNIRDDEIRLEKVTYTGKEGKSAQGCPIAKWIIRRSSLKEKALVLIRQIRYHYCSSSIIVIGICLWDGLPEDHATELYDYLRITLPKYGEATERRCATNDRKTCACQGWNESSGGASFSFGCSWSMYYNGCKFARSSSPRRFHLKNNYEEELILEHHLQTLATTVAPIYEKVAPTSFKNQTMFESVASDCRLGYKPGRPWSGVTAVVDFCTHSHKDFNNMNNGCTTVLTLTKHRGLQTPEDEQLHVLPLCVLDSAEESGDEVMRKMKSGALECLTSYPAVVRIRATPYMCKRKQRLVKANLKKKISWNNLNGRMRKYNKNVSFPQKSLNERIHNYAPIGKMTSKQDACFNPTFVPKTSSTVLPAFSQFVSSLTNFRKYNESNHINTTQCSSFLKRDLKCDKMKDDTQFEKNGNDFCSVVQTNVADIKYRVDLFPVSPVISNKLPHYNVPIHDKPTSQYNFNNLSEQSFDLLHQRHKPSLITAVYPNSLQGQPYACQNTTSLFPKSVTVSNFSDKSNEILNPRIEQKLEIFTNNCDVFQDAAVGGVAIALTHGSLLFEVAKRELHATTALKRPDRSRPTRMSLVFYQHKSLNRDLHGRAEYEKKLKERRDKKVEEMTQKCLNGEPTETPIIQIKSENIFSSPQVQHQNVVYSYPRNKTLFQQNLDPRDISQNVRINAQPIDFPRAHVPFKESNARYQHDDSIDDWWQKQNEGLQFEMMHHSTSDRFSHEDGAVD